MKNGIIRVSLVESPSWRFEKKFNERGVKPMGERIQQVAGIIFALAFIAILAMINTNILGFGTSVNDKLARSYADTEAYELQAFDDTRFTGSTVISAVNNRENLYTTPLEIHLNGTVVTSVSTTPGSANYVNSAGAYTAQLLVNTNDIVYGIEFTTA